MKQQNNFLKALAAIFTLLLICTPAFANWDSAEEIRRLNKEAPSIDGFKGADCVVWLANNEYKMLLDGSLEKRTYEIFMLGEKVPEVLTDIRVPIPLGGAVDIIDAAWYNPMTAMKEGSLTVSEETLAGGASVKRISAPDTAIGRAVVIAIKEVSPKRYSVDGIITMAGDLPHWEQNLVVEVSEGQELAWTGREVNEPEIVKDSQMVKYKWKVMNQEAWFGEGFVEYKRPFVAFGLKKGMNQTLATVSDFANMIKTPPLPSFVRSGDQAKTGLKLMEWISEPSKTLKGYPRNWIRANEQIPENGPWTPWEQTLILNKWLQQIGWSSEVWWHASASLNDDTPATKDIFFAPVLYTSPGVGSGKKSYYQAGQVSDYGVIAPALTSSQLYRLNNKEEVEKRTTSEGSAAGHKLSMLWKLTLGSDGAASGILDVTATGGWAELFSSGRLPEKQNMGDFLRKQINFALPGLELTPKNIVQTGSGYKMAFAVKCAPGIIHGGNLLLRLPGGVPLRLGEMIGQESNYTFRFPFTIDQKVRMKMPGGYKMVQQPAIVNGGEGSKATLKQSITHWPKKAELLADSTWTVKTRTVDTALGALLKEELAACLRWPVLNLPFRK